MLVISLLYDLVHDKCIVRIRPIRVYGSARTGGRRKRLYVFFRGFTGCAHMHHSLTPVFPLDVNENLAGLPRVNCIASIRVEPAEILEIALEYHAELLKADSTNAVCGAVSSSARPVLIFFSRSNFELPEFSPVSRATKMDT